MPDAHYDNPRLASLYDLGNGWAEDSDFYLALAGDTPVRILDLGCGTGILADAYAGRGHKVTAADPSAAMLEEARRKPHGGAVRWVQASAQDFRSEERFDVIVMTGHAFQTLLGDDDIRACFAAMRAHLAPGGTVAFESRNPAIDWPSRWAYAIELDAPEGPVRETRELVGREADRMTFALNYRFPDGEDLLSMSTLRFASREEIEALLEAENLVADRVLGDWTSAPFDQDASPEMIFLAHAA